MGQDRKNNRVLCVIICVVGLFFLGLLCEGLRKNTKYLDKVEIATSSATIKSDCSEQCEQHFLDWIVDDWQPKQEFVALDLWGQAKELDEKFDSGFRLRRMVAEFLKQTKGTRVSSSEGE